ncbi:MAG: DUF4262 domain-containing protein [Myxococcota bacterium]|nr:DUF4262 domain-containing protein [Myxococcota bacterium]
MSEGSPPGHGDAEGNADQDVVDARVRADIDRFGWHAALFPADGSTPGWAVTVGLFERFDHPEVVIFGPDLQSMNGLLTHVAHQVVHGRRFEAGEDAHDVLKGQAVGFRPVARKWIAPFLGNVAWHYRNEDFPVLQCFWPDPGGRLPWHEGADPDWRDDQPQLFHQETHRALSEALIEALRREGAL